MQVPGQVQRGSEKVPKVPEKVGEAMVQSQVRFNRVPEKVPEKVWEASVQSQALVQSQVRFIRVPENVPEKVWEALVQSQVKFHRVAEKVPEMVLGSVGAKPSQVQEGSREGSWRIQKGYFSCTIKFEQVERVKSSKDIFVYDQIWISGENEEFTKNTFRHTIKFEEIERVKNS